MSTANRLIKNTGFLYARMIITMVLALYTTRIVLAALGEQDFGVFNIVGGAIALLGFLSTTLTSTTQRFINISEGEGDLEKQRSVYNVSIIAHLILAVIVGLTLVIAGFIFFNGLLNIPYERTNASIVVYCCLLVSTIITIIGVPYNAIINAHENMRYFAIIGICESVCRFLVAVYIKYTPFDKLIVYGVLLSIIPLVFTLIVYYYCKRHYSECLLKPHKYWSKTILKDELSFASWNLLTALSMGFTTHAMGIVINHFFGVLINAAQGVALQVGGAVSHFSESALKALNPIIVKSEGERNREKLIYTSMLGCRTGYCIFCFFSIPLIWAMPAVLKLWLVTVPEWAVVFCRLQLIYFSLAQLFGSVGTAVYAEGNIKNYTIIKSALNIAPLFVAPLLFYFGFPPFAIYILQILFWGVGGCIVVLYFASKQVGYSIKAYFQGVIVPAVIVVTISVLVLVGGSFCFSRTSFISYVIPLFVETILYTLLSWRLLLNTVERTQIKMILLKLIWH